MMSAIKTPNRRSQTPFSVCSPRDLQESRDSEKSVPRPNSYIKIGLGV